MPYSGPITSLQNPRIKLAARLHERKHRAAEEPLVIDGAREVLRAIAAGITIREAFVCLTLCTTPAARAASAALEGAAQECWEVSPAVFEKLAFGQRTEGVVAIATPPRTSLDDIPHHDGALVIVLEEVKKPGNVGAVLRTADAAGADGMIVADPRTDLFNLNAIRASLGAIFTVPCCAADGNETIRWLREHGFSIFAARVNTATRYDQVNYRGRVAIVLGSEANGLSERWTGAAVTPITLPMRGQVDSLNVSAAAAVLTYEAQRQRHSK